MVERLDADVAAIGCGPTSMAAGWTELLPGSEDFVTGGGLVEETAPAEDASAL